VKVHTRARILVSAPGLAPNLSRWEIIFSPKIISKVVDALYLVVVMELEF
jgi:hypothetical protein